MVACEACPYLVGVVTVSVSVGFELVAEVLLLETSPSASTPITVNVYVLLGVIPFGVVVEVPVLPHAGIRNSAPVITRIITSIETFRDRFSLTAAPRPTVPSMDKESHIQRP
jgi:hypothetical protein